MFDTPEITREMIEEIPEDQRGPWLAHLEARERAQVIVAELEENGEWRQAALYFDSKHRAEAFTRWAPRMTDDEVRELLTNEWSVTEAWGGDAKLREGMIGLLRRVAPLVVLADTDDEFVQGIGTLTIYRGNVGEDPRLGHSWTLDKEIAQRFARMAMSPRGMYLGMYREDGIPTVWQAEVDSRDILGYFNDRAEREVVVDPATLRDVTKIQEAR